MENLHVNKDLCISCGSCVAIAPNVFEFGDDDKAQVKTSNTIENEKEDVIDATESCPTSAISYND